ncbi:hypothetical protein E2C01_088004 [Portunus trituberculatus]|uniref:Uncharacterized protein n=1 Tax=Portunus trituberculatus TaxID=210409 RepID=A0A5B7J4Z9_PORTR|nr:hypothetical protein [Portunus trituberculatus]
MARDVTVPWELGFGGGGWAAHLDGGGLASLVQVMCGEGLPREEHLSRTSSPCFTSRRPSADTSSGPSAARQGNERVRKGAR